MTNINNLFEHLDGADDWLRFILDPSASVEDAIAAHTHCFKDQSSSKLPTSVIPFLWKHFDDEAWRNLLVKEILQQINEYSNTLQSDAIGLPLYARLFFSSLNISKEHIYSSGEHMKLKPPALAFLAIMRKIIDKKPLTSSSANWCQLGVQHGVDDEGLVTSLLAANNWENLTALPPNVLNRIFQAAVKDSRFSEGSENDLRLFNKLVGFEAETPIENHYLNPQGETIKRGSAPKNLLIATEYAETNRYWRALVLNCYGAGLNSCGDSYTRDFLDKYKARSQHWFEGDSLLHMFQVMETDSGTITPTWLRNFFMDEKVQHCYNKDKLWAHCVPEWAENASSWEALGMERHDKVKACILLLNTPSFKTIPTLPDNVGLT